MAKDYFGMQQEALRRAREMYSRGKPQEINKKEALKPEENKSPVQKNQNKKQGIVEFLLKDKDTTIILALLILLSGEKTDSSLIFALLFLLT